MLFLAVIAGLLVVNCTLAVKTPANEDYYMAAVVEYNPKQGVDGNTTLSLNTQEFVKLIAKAANYSDIVVFPEAALLHGDMSVFLEVPMDKNLTTPADNYSWHPTLMALSEAARNNSIYVVVNIHEVENSGNSTTKYNTNVVFDRNGTVVAKYRKYNLFSEVKILNVTNYPEHVYFDTDFGVRFGTFICFDILFKEPTLTLKNYNVTDYVFPTWWYSELPFLTAVQHQAAWAYVTDSNLLAAGGNHAAQGSTGTGIYAGKRGPVIYTQSNNNETVLLTAKVFKKNKIGTSSGQRIESEDIEKGRLKMKTDPSLKYYRVRSLDPELTNPTVTNRTNITQISIFEHHVCQFTFCCHYSINMSFTFVSKTSSSVNVTKLTEREDGFHHYRYKVGVFNGVRSFDNCATGGVQACGIIPCLNGSKKSCGLPTLGAPLTVMNHSVYGELYLLSTRFESVILKATSLDPEAFVEPSILESSIDSNMFGSLLSPEKYKFTQNGTTAELRVSSDRLGTAAIFARVFSRDGSLPGVSSSSIVNVHVPLFVITVLFELIYFKFIAF